MLSNTIFLLLPALASASIRLYMKASSDETMRDIEYIGANVEVLGDARLGTFGLIEDSLKEAVKAYSGETPAKIYLRNPTDDNAEFKDLYVTNAWNQVSRTIIPFSGTMVNFSTEPLEMASEVIANVKNEKISHNLDLEADLIKLVEARWLAQNRFTKTEFSLMALARSGNIFYAVDFGVDGIEEIDKVTFEERFKNKVNWKKESNVHKVLDVEMEAGQQLEAILKATRYTFDYQVNYTISFGGDVACYYPEGHKGRNFWAYEINEVLKAGEMKNKMEFIENIKVTYDTNPQLTVEEL